MAPKAKKAPAKAQGPGKAKVGVMEGVGRGHSRAGGGRLGARRGGARPAVAARRPTLRPLPALFPARRGQDVRPQEQEEVGQSPKVSLERDGRGRERGAAAPSSAHPPHPAPSPLSSYVAQVQKQAAVVPAPDSAAARKAKKAAAEEAARELNSLLVSNIKQPKLAVGVDPKSVLCEFFRAGQCAKGFKCKFSHDPAVERKAVKADVFTDRRDGGGGSDDEGMDDWDQDTLEDVVKRRHGTEAAPANRTDIICKFFLDAVERRQYGWFWQCPNGNKECKYRHALPPGYVLKSQMKELLAAEAAAAPSVEEAIEEARSKVDAKTPITEAVFRAWQDAQAAAKKAAAASDAAERAKKGALTGREIFALDGFEAEDDAGASAAYERERDEEAAIAEAAAAAATAAAAARAAAPAPASAALDEAGALLDDDDDDDDDLDALEAALAAQAAVK